jgi:hypothetical protein
VGRVWRAAQRATWTRQWVFVVVAVAGGDAVGVGGLEGGVGEEVEAVVGVVGAGIDEAVAEASECVLGELFPGYFLIVNAIDEPYVA